MQSAYLSKLLELAEKDSNVLHLVADSGTGIDEMLFRRNFPNQMLNFGIAEENMVAAAAGLASAGKIPFIYASGAFLAYRAMEFIRDDICFQNQNVKIIGVGSGLSLCTLGPSHHTTEDISVLRAIPNLTLLSAATPLQAAACAEYAYAHCGPVYIRIGMNNEREFYNDGYELPESGYDVIAEGSRVAILTTGSILDDAEKAVHILNENGIAPALVNVVRIKPFNEECILKLADSVDFFVTVEEHNIYGGLGSIAAEVIAGSGLGKKLVKIGLDDIFASGYRNTHEEIKEENGLDALSIANNIQGAIV